jgi:hypothetical protein
MGDVPDGVDPIDSAFAGSVFLKAHVANYLIYSTGVFALIWAAVNVMKINAITMTADKVKVHELTEQEKRKIESEGKDMPPQTQEECLA